MLWFSDDNRYHTGLAFVYLHFFYPTARVFDASNVGYLRLHGTGFDGITSVATDALYYSAVVLYSSYTPKASHPGLHPWSCGNFYRVETLLAAYTRPLLLSQGQPFPISLWAPSHLSLGHLKEY